MNFKEGNSSSDDTEIQTMIFTKTQKPRHLKQQILIAHLTRRKMIDVKFPTGKNLVGLIS